MRQRSWQRLALVLLLCLSLSGVVQPRPVWGAADEETVQVAGYYITPAVDLLRRYAIISGDPDGGLRLGATMNRAELIKVVITAMGQGGAAVQAATEPAPFPDVAGHWAKGYIAVAKRLGIASGYSDGTFRPANPVTHAEAITLLLRAAGLKPQGPWPEAVLQAARTHWVLSGDLERVLPPGEVATRAAVFLLAERAFTGIRDAQGRNLLQRTFGGPGLTLSIIGPTGNPAVTSAASVIVTGTAPGAVAVRVGQQVVAPVGGRFTATVPLDPGRNELVILAADDLGRVVQQRLVIERK